VEEVTDETFEAEVLAADGPVIVDFWAPWCKPCDAIEPHLRAIAKERGVRLVRIDIDANLGVPSRLGVLALPTVILFLDGEPRVTVYGAHAREHYERAFSPTLDSR
jgi:thioredoxin 1